jgi:hypothetical protein
MGTFLLAASTAATGAAPTTGPTTAPALQTMLTLPGHWPGQTDVLNWCQSMPGAAAMVLLVLGVLYLLFSATGYQVLMLVNSAIAGAWAGAMIGSTANQTIAGACAGAVIAAAVAWPMMKWAVAVFGGLVGIILGMSTWRAFGLDIGYAWAGGLTGLVFFGMLTFILFRGSVMLFLSLQGAAMLVAGAMALLTKSPDVTPKLAQSLTASPIILPMAVFIPAVLGLIYQQSGGGGEAPAAKKK